MAGNPEPAARRPLRAAIALAAAAIAAFGLVAVVHEATRDRIAATERARELARFDQVLGGLLHDNDLLADTVTLRATRTRRPDRSISISVRLVSSSSSASSRMSALSSLFRFAADLSADLLSGWRAMLLIRNSRCG